MSDDDNRAKQDRAPRYDVDWSVKLRCASWSDVQQVAALNVGRGGLFVRSPAPPPVGTRVQVDVELPDGSRFQLGGVCVHTRTPEQAQREGRQPGLGVKIDSEHAGDLLLLQDIAKAASGAGGWGWPKKPGG